MDKSFEIIYINGLSKDELIKLIEELKQKYKEVIPYYGRFVWTAEYYGEINVR